ncbi:MAG TPA: FHA domain-containing protein [Ktedonobacteraceae bacterium]|nr:FHA domain-containing protein [Ktedonobacteraceae bacterium]
MPTLQDGQRFERYRIRRFLGSSAAGESYEAEDTMLLRKVTLKLIHPWTTLPDAARRQFFREMQGISILNHPYLAAVLDYGEINSRLYVARRYVTSSTLLGNEGRMWFGPPLKVADAIHHLHQLAQALQYIHNHGYLHGSMTFSNILLLRGPNLDNEPDYAPFLLADVGLTNFVRRFGQPQNQFLPITAAPEQYSKRVFPVSDQYSLAVLLYFWFTGQPPYLGTPEEIQHLKCSATIAPPTSLNPQVTFQQEAMLLRALSASPEDRYPSVLAFTDALLATLIPEPQIFSPNEPLAQANFTAPISARGEEEAQTTPEVEAVAETEPISQIQSEILVETVIEDTPNAFSQIESTPIPESITHLEAISAQEFGVIPETDPVLFSEPIIEIDELMQAEPIVEAEEAQFSSGNSVEFEFANQAGTPFPPENSDEAGSEIQTEASADATSTAEDQLAQPIPQPGPTPPPPPPAPEPSPVPNPEPAPPPSPAPDIPQPIPEPDVPQPTPNPIPTPQPDIPQTPPEPGVPQPVPDPIPQPVPDVPQPLPEPSIPQTTPQTLPQAEFASIDKLTDYSELLPQTLPEQAEANPRLIIVSPYAEQPLEFKLESDEITLGRAGSSDILLDLDNLTSRHHALLRHEGNSYIIYDRRSANGVFVNGQKIDTQTGCELADGDHISIGNYEIIFRLSPVMSMALE